MVLNSQNLDTCQNLSNPQFEKLVFNVLSMRRHHVYCIKVIWTSLLFWLVTWAYITKRTQHLPHSELLGNQELPLPGTRNNTGALPAQQMDQGVPAPAQPHSPWTGAVCVLSTNAFLTGVYPAPLHCMPWAQINSRQKSTPMFSLWTDPLLCQCLCLSNTVQTVSSTQFSFHHSNSYPEKKTNKQALGWQIMYHQNY